MAKKAPSHEKPSASEEISKKFKQSPALYIGSVVILVLVIVTFLGGDLLSGGRFGGGGNLTFGYYDRAPISWVAGNILHQYVDQASQWYRAQGMDPNEPWISSQVWRYAYDAAVVHTAILQVMKKSKYQVPDSLINRNIAKMPRFQENDRFSPALYNMMPESSRTSLWQQTQEDMTKMMFFTDLFGLKIPSSEAAFIANMAAPTRSFDMVSFSVDDFPASEYLTLAMENIELFSSIHLSKISVNNEREAKRILESLRNGNSLFEEEARHSQDGYADRGGDMGRFYMYELESEIPSLFDRQAVSGLARGELSEVINSYGMWSIFRAEEELLPPDFDDPFVMDRVRSYIRNFQRGRMEDWAINNAMDFIAEVNNSGFDITVRRRNLDKQSFGPLPINFGGLDLFTSLDSFTIPGLSSHELGTMSRNDNFWRIAFSTELRTPSLPFVHGSNIIVFYPTAELGAQEDTISNIESMYTSYWLNNETERSLTTYFMNHDKMEDNFWEVYGRIFR